MIKRFFIIAVCLLFIFSCFLSCSSNVNDDDDNDNITDDRTLVIFDNTGGKTAVAVYNDHNRRESDKLAEVHPGQQSNPIEYSPGSQVPFWFKYIVGLTGIDGFSFDYIPTGGRDQNSYIIEEKKRNTVVIPKLEETLTSQDQLLTNSVYVLIQNESSFTVSFLSGESPLKPDNMDTDLVMAGRKACYKITAQAVSNYKIRLGADYYLLDEPEDSFSAGHFYVYSFNLGVVSLDSVTKCIFENIAEPSLSSYPPENITANAISASSIRISWNKVEEASGYGVYRSTSTDGEYELINNVMSPTYDDTGLSPSTAYFYKITTIGLNGESGQSNAVSATTMAQDLIQAPTGLSASAQSSTSIRITWNAVAGATSYRVFRSNSSSGSYNFIQNVNTNSYTDSGLSSRTTYYYKVSAVANSNESSQSAGFASATTMDDGGTIPYPPTKPTGLVVTSASSGSVSLSWNSVATADKYNIYRAGALNGAQSFVATVTETSYTDYGLPAGTQNFYTVEGENTSGKSPKSDIAFGITASYYDLGQGYYNSQLLTIYPGTSNRHYYRFSVTQGQSYTITWQNGNNANLSGDVRVAAWQNNGTNIFNDAVYGYGQYARGFIANSTGFVTIELYNRHSTNSYNYQIYY